MVKVKIDVALLIVLLTGVAYGTAYLFEFNYQAYYKLPIMFIDLNITTLTRSLLFTLLLAGFALILSNFITSLIIKAESPNKDIPVIVFMFFIIFLLGSAFFLGDILASTKEEYMVLKQNEELFVVVTLYNDNLIIAPLDIKTETMSPEFQAIEINSMKETQIINFENGLKVKESKSSKEIIEQLN